ncbi:hypothetical protein EV121DRAFT_263905 [Schizophyllum commune]
MVLIRAPSVESLSTVSSIRTEMSDETPATATNTKQHAKYYLKDGNIEFELDDGTLYKVHRHFFETYSDKFAGEFLSGGANEGRAKLPGVSGRDFDRLLSLIYPTALGVRDIKTADEWLSVLRLATKWSFGPLRDLAFAEFTPIASPIDNIVAARELDKPEYLLPALVKVCAAPKWLTLEEAERLGMKTVVEIGRLREEMRKGPVDIRRALVDAGLAPRSEGDATQAENAAGRHGRNGPTSLESFLSVPTHTDPPSYNSPGPRYGRIVPDVSEFNPPPTPPDMYEEFPSAPSRTSVRTYSTFGRPPTPPPPPAHITAPRTAAGEAPRMTDADLRQLFGEAPRIFGGDAPRGLGGDALRVLSGDVPRIFGGEGPRAFGAEGSRNLNGHSIFGPSHGNSTGGGLQTWSDFVAAQRDRAPNAGPSQGFNARPSQGLHAGASQGLNAGASQGLNAGPSSGANLGSSRGVNASSTQGFTTGVPLPPAFSLFSNAGNANLSTQAGSRFP